MAPERVDFVTRWDLDQTYLYTELDSLRELLRWAVEQPDRERAVPGALPLLRELGSSGARIHIISGSSPRLRPGVEEKLRLDRVRWDELTLIPNLAGLLGLRSRAFRHELGHKLPALLEARVRDQQLGEAEHEPPEILVGDDAHANAYLYSLYADILTGRVDRSSLKRVLAHGGVRGTQSDRCLEALSRLGHGLVVERILIRLDRRAPPSSYDQHGARLVPFYNYLQAALVLLEDQRLDAAAVARVASSFVLFHGFDHEAMARSYLDLMRRGHAHGAAAEPLRCAVEELRHADDPPPTLDSLQRMCDLLDEYARSPPERVDRRAGELDHAALARRYRRQ
jgi:hypothetical protein